MSLLMASVKKRKKESKIMKHYADGAVLGRHCIITECQNDASIPRKVRFLKQLGDYKITVGLCSDHKNRLKGPDPVIKIDLEGLGNEEILGETEDKSKQKAVKESFDYLRKQAKLDHFDQSANLLIEAARHFAKEKDGKFLFGFYFGKLIMISSFRELLGGPKNENDAAKEKRVKQIRSQMALKTTYAQRDHPDTRNELVDICRCGHGWFIHSGSSGTGECYLCLCPNYVFEQKITSSEASALQTLLYQELGEKNKNEKVNDRAQK